MPASSLNLRQQNFHIFSTGDIGRMMLPFGDAESIADTSIFNVYPCLFRDLIVFLSFFSSLPVEYRKRLYMPITLAITSPSIRWWHRFPFTW